MDEKRLMQHLRTFDKTINSYYLQVPLNRFLSQYFRENKKMGSNDRRTASNLVYNFFRLGKALEEKPLRERLAIAEFLCVGESGFTRLILSDLASALDEDLTERVKVCRERFGFRLESIFPLVDKISSEIEKIPFLLSHFIQPDLFIRIHPEYEYELKASFQDLGLVYKEIDKYSLSFPNKTKLDQIPSIQGKYEVQDFSSQQTGRLFRPLANESWWDACAGSGGKSILLKQQEPNLKLLVSDIRNSILRNLDERFDRARIGEYRRKIIDLTKASNILEDEVFDGVILDAPCSGSGTWGRTPEMMTIFQPNELHYYTDLQRRIVENVIPHVKSGKHLIYITCSVFEDENEQIVNFMEEKGMFLEESYYIKGYTNKADTLFAARLTR